MSVQMGYQQLDSWKNEEEQTSIAMDCLDQLVWLTCGRTDWTISGGQQQGIFAKLLRKTPKYIFWMNRFLVLMRRLKSNY